MQDLIKRIEAAEGPSRELDEDIALSLGIVMKRLKRGEWEYPDGTSNGLASYTSSIDAAMTLAEKHHGDIIREALSRLSSKFNLHICFWPDSENYSEWLARFVCAAALRAKIAKNEG